MIDLDELERLEQAATPAPWKESEWDHEPAIAYQIMDADGDYDWQYLVPQDKHYTPGVEADISFILALRNAAPELFAELEQARERIRELEAELADKNNQLGDEIYKRQELEDNLKFQHNLSVYWKDLYMKLRHGE